MRKEVASKAKKTSPIATMLKSITTFMDESPRIYEVLENDHRKVETLFAQIEAEKSSERKRELIGDLVMELSAHAEAEQKVVYNALKKSDEAQDIVLEAVEEHHIVEILLGEISRARSKDTPVIDAKIKVLKEMVEHHVREEESELFDKARQAFSAEQEMDIAQRFLKAKERILTAR